MKEASGQKKKSEADSRVKLCNPLMDTLFDCSQVPVNLLYFYKKVAGEQVSYDNNDEDSSNMLFMPLVYNVKQFSWQNLWIDYENSDNSQQDEDAPRVSEKQRERILFEQLKTKMTSLRKEREKKENELENLNTTYNDLKKEQMILEIKNTLLTQMKNEKKLEYKKFVDDYYQKSLRTPPINSSE